MNDQIEFRGDLVTGMWKFRDTVEIVQLHELISEWLEEEGHPYLDLYIRSCSKDQNGIGFQRRLLDESYGQFFHRMTDQLKRRFGNDLVGWDISSSTYIVHIPSPSARHLARIWWFLFKETDGLDKHSKISKVLQTVDLPHTEDFMVRYREAVAFAYEAYGLCSSALPDVNFIFEEVEEEAFLEYTQSSDSYDHNVQRILAELYGEDVSQVAFYQAKTMYLS